MPFDQPRASSAARVAPIDCGLICSTLAITPGVVGPLRSRRTSAEVSGSVSSSSPSDLRLAEPAAAAA